jgi:hypothetical protein
MQVSLREETLMEEGVVDAFGAKRRSSFDFVLREGVRGEGQ